MCGGSKGQSQTTQNQTYTPNAQAQGYITDALSRAQQTANLPFNIPQAPVAGFSQDQNQAFGNVRNAQGMAQPYINQAQGYFNQSATPDVASFYNPMAQNVTNQLQNIFGQQNTQNTGNLVQSAGGVGADRVAVGQANMANQQGLAAGQTYAGLYQQAVQAAQQQQNIQQAAGYGTAAMGSAAQNSALQGAQAELGTGSLQQQLQQAQLNSPYQQQVAQAAFPYQQSQFYGNMVGALAPGLGGTTAGAGTATPAQPSMWSQILGGGMAGAGALGYLGTGGSGYQNSTSNYLGMSDAQQDAWQDNGNYLPSARGGAIPGYDDGGDVSDKPINIAANPFIPQTQMHAIQPHIPQLQQQQQQPQSGGGLGDILKMGAQILPMFLNRGGTVPGYDDGGDVINPDEPFRMPDQKAVDEWRSGVARDMAEGRTEQPTEEASMPRERPGRMTASAVPPHAMAFAGSPDAPSDLPPEISGGNSYAAQRAPAGGGAPSGAGSENPYSIPMTAAGRERQNSFGNSPWAALMQAGLGIMGGTSPFAGVNIGQGGMQGLKALQEQDASSQKDETIAQAAKRLQQEAQFHEDQYNRTTPYQKWEMGKPVPAGQVYDPATGLNRTQYMLPDGKGGWKTITQEGGTPAEQPLHASIGDAIISGEQPPTTTGLGKVTPQVRAYLHQNKFDLAKAQLEYKQAEKQIQALNGPQMQRGYALYKSVTSTIDEVKDLSEQMRLGGIPLMNKLELGAYIQAQGNSEKGQVATRYMTAINTLKEEFANLANGGYAPTEPAWKLADEQVNGNYGTKQLGASLDEIKRLITYRMEFVAKSPVGPGSANRYTGQQAQPAEGAGGAGAPAASTAPARAPQDQQALDWANANPNDPRAAAIKQRLGVQ